MKLYRREAREPLWLLKDAALGGQRVPYAETVIAADCSAGAPAA